MRRQAGVSPPPVAMVTSYTLAVSESRKCQIRKSEREDVWTADTWSTREHLTKQDKLR